MCVCGNIEENKRNQMQSKVICEATNTLTFFLSYDEDENSGNPLMIVSKIQVTEAIIHTHDPFFVYLVSCMMIDMRLCS